MKFSHGYWRMRPGVQTHYAAQAYDIETTPHSMTVYAPTQRITDRSLTLNIPLLTVELASPLPDVIRVRLTHWSGQPDREPQFELHEQPETPVQIAVDEQAATFTSGRLSARIPRQGDWRLDFLGDGHPLTSSGPGGMGIAVAQGVHYIHEQLALDVGEYVYGLGERFTPFVKNGQVVDLWNEDGGTCSEQAYKNIPFYLTNRGYGVFVNHPGLVSYEIGSEKVARVQFSVADQSLEYFLIYGPTPKEVLEKYTALTGRPALPPAWSFGLWLSTSFTTNYDEATVTSFIEGMAERDIPLHVFHFDCFWMREFNWCDFTWDARTFPDPAAMLSRLKARGLRICVWINPYIAQRSPLFAEGMQQGYLLCNADGSVWQTDDWQSGMGVVDFTNPDARAWYAGQLRRLLDLGVDCFKTDFGERIPPEAVYFNGADPVRMHNYYTFLYNRTVFEVLQERFGVGEATVFARSGTTGSQQFPVHWGGDSETTFASMAETLRGGLSLALSGFSFWSHDIGGFTGVPDLAVYKRWIAFGLLSSHSRLHGSTSYRVPWTIDEQAVNVLRQFTRLKCRLMPYLYAAAIEAHRTGVPVLRPMLLEFPDDPACETLDRQYMLGDSLLVAPVFTASGEVTYYVPAGRWTDFFTGETVDGPRWVHARHDYLSLPLLVRPGSVLALGAQDDRPDYDFAEGVTLQIYQSADGQHKTVVIPTLSGGTAATFSVRHDGNLVTVKAHGADRPWQAKLVSQPDVKLSI